MPESRGLRIQDTRTSSDPTLLSCRRKSSIGHGVSVFSRDTSSVIRHIDTCRYASDCNRDIPTPMLDRILEQIPKEVPNIRLVTFYLAVNRDLQSRIGGIHFIPGFACNIRELRRSMKSIYYAVEL